MVLGQRDAKKKTVRHEFCGGHREVHEEVHRHFRHLRMRKEEMEVQLNSEAKPGWRFAADWAKIADAKASSEDRKHESGGVFLAIDGGLGAVIDKVAVTSIPRNEGIPAQASVECQRKFAVCAVFWSSQKVGRREMKLRCSRGPPGIRG